MSILQSKKFLFAGAVAAAVFSVLLSVRFGVFDKTGPASASFPLSAATVNDRETWMNILQEGKKIGFSNTRLKKIQDRYEFHETVSMRINTMGIVQDISMKSDGTFNPDFSLSSVDFEISSGRFQFRANAVVSENAITVVTDSSGDQRTMTIPITTRPYLVSGIMNAVSASQPEPGKSYSFDIFDPATIGQETVLIHIIGRDAVQLKTRIEATKLAIEFKGLRQYAWIDDAGDILKESGLLGISLEKTTREDALLGLPVESSSDLTHIASVKSNVLLLQPETLSRLIVRIDGIDPKNLQLEGGRQTLKGMMLTIEKEAFPPEPDATVSDLDEYLKPTPFIQSDHPTIQKLAGSIASDDDAMYLKAEKLIQWVYQNIEKQPVLSAPSALSTLENRVGDCNEHAVLLAALAQAAGIPVQVEVGLVYLKGRFYYHAWNSLYIGKWITADALFGQMPADVTHIRFSTGTRQLDLMGVIGKISLEVIEFY